MNRVDRLLSALRTAGPRGVCLADSPWPEDAYCWRNAVSEARAQGFAIAGRPCTKHPHRGRVLAYVSLEGRSNPGLAGKAEVIPHRLTGLPVSPPIPTLFDEPYRRTGAAL